MRQFLYLFLIYIDTAIAAQSKGKLDQMLCQLGRDKKLRAMCKDGRRLTVKLDKKVVKDVKSLNTQGHNYQGIGVYCMGEAEAVMDETTNVVVRVLKVKTRKGPCNGVVVQTCTYKCKHMHICYCFFKYFLIIILTLMITFKYITHGIYLFINIILPLFLTLLLIIITPLTIT